MPDNRRQVVFTRVRSLKNQILPYRISAKAKICYLGASRFRSRHGSDPVLVVLVISGSARKFLMTYQAHFADRLCAAIKTCQTPLIVGIDPRTRQLPPKLLGEVRSGDQASVARAFSRFGREIIDVVSPLVPAIKPQAAFFEMLGPAGMTALAEVIDHAVAAGLLVILDGKRNDIGSTAQAYADAYLGRKPESAWGCDALTINPYMGDDSMQPFIDRCVATGSGVFALLKTSNPGSQLFQELSCGAMRLYQHVGKWIDSAAAATAGKCGYGVIGAVVGATHPQHLGELRQSMPNTLFLVPGYGAQGGNASELRGAFDGRGLGAVINSSRAIIFAYENPRYSKAASWQASVEQATRDAIAEIGNSIK